MNEVKKPKKPLISYYCIVLLILILFNSLAMPWLMEHQIKDVDYGTFIQMTEDGNVDVLISKSRVIRLYLRIKRKTIYQTAMVDDPDLTDRLYQAGVSFYGEEIKQTSPILSFLMTWILPLLIFGVIGELLARQLMKKQAAKCHELWHG